MQSDQSAYLVAIQSSDPQGLKAIYRDFLPKIRTFVSRNGGSEADAEDVFQDALLVLFDKTRKDDFVLSSAFYTLLYGICRNLWGNRLQKKSRTEVTLQDDFKYSDEESILFNLEEAERQSLFWDSFHRLKPECQTLLQLFFKKKSMEEIATTLSFSSVAYAKKRKFLCKEQLIKFVKADRRYQSYL